MADDRMTVKIKIGRSGLSALVDSDMAHLNNFKWHTMISGKGTYAVNSFKKDNGRYGNLFMHHAVVGFPLKGKEVDHVNGNKLDNRRQNLRIVTVRENQCNQVVHRNGKTPGVYKFRRKWRAQFQFNSRTILVGYYPTEQLASKAREIMIPAYEDALKLWSEIEGTVK